MRAEIDLKRYDLFGWDYPILNALREPEWAWYKLWAGRTGGPILELACGSGRLCCLLAAAGYWLVGLDLSDSMLGLASQNVQALPEQARQRVSLIKADMTAFDLGSEFPLAIIADNSIRELQTYDQVLSCLRCLRRHLVKGGVLLVTMRRFDETLLQSRRKVWDWSAPMPHPRTGEPVSRRIELELSRDDLSLFGRMTYRILHADGRQSLDECPFTCPVLREADFRQLFGKAGFTSELFVGYQERPDDGKDATLCFVCRAR
jgi:ubiquinone/menaquinone biosynthesis C-methylase UbiE